MPPAAQSLVGRERELAELEATFTDVAGGRGGLVLFVGAPGIGKTRLADELAAIASARGARVAWGRAWEAGGAPAYWPWIDALRALGADGEPLAQALAAGAPEGGERSRFLLHDAVATGLTAAARERPLVLILDDLHAADLATLALVHFVARRLRGSRLLLVGTYRDVAAGLSPEAAEALGKVAREGRYLHLAPLDRATVVAWVEAQTGGAGEAQAIFDTSEGNPLFVVELLRLARDRGTAGALAAGRLPEGVRDVIRAHLAGLSAAALDFWRGASVLGRTVELAAAAALLAVEPARARAFADEAVRAEVVHDAGGGRYVFQHILLREVLHAELAPARREALHAAQARALFAVAGPDAGASLSEALHHLFAAGPAVPPEETLGWARRAARRASARLAFDEAAAALERAAYGLAPGPEAERCDLLLELAEALTGAGRATRGCETALAAAALARALGDSERLARAALAYGGVFRFGVVDTTLVGLLREALAALPPGESPLAARLTARLAAALQPSDDPRPPIALAHEAIAMARRVADERTRLGVLVAATSALSYFEDPVARRPLDEELIALAERAGDRVALLRGHMRLVWDRLEAGDAEAADAHVAEHDRLARATGLPELRWRALLLLGMRAIMRGEVEPAARLADEAAALAARIDDSNAPFSLALQRLGRLWIAGRTDELARWVDGTTELAARVVDPVYARCLRAGMLARVGRAGDARADLAWLAAHPEVFHLRPMLAWAAEAAIALEDRALAARLLEALAPLAARLHCWGALAMICETPLSHPIARLSAFLGDRAAAERAFDDARRRSEALGAAPHLAWIERDREAALGGGPGAAARRVRPSKPPASSPPPITLTRDGDVWRIDGERGASFRLKDSRGLQILATLVAAPGREFHATELVAPGGQPGLVEDAGEALDPQAIAAYRARLEDLRDAEREAEAHGDPHRAERARAEIEAIADELARGVGLGGRARKTSSTAEKARINVRQRLQDAITRIGEQDPALGKHLRQAVRTGVFCSYDP